MPDLLAQRKRRGTPLSLFAPADPHAPLAPPALEAYWIEPLPDTLVDEQRGADPEARYDVHESVTFAFLSAIQSLPGRQRAVLLLRDVLGWSAGETAEILDMTVAAVNSALQRARATMKQGQTDPDTRDPARDGDEQTTALLARYVQAWESADSAALVALLREDATLSMPPLPAWYRGAADIQTFLDRHIFVGDGRGRFRLAATRANGCPAFGMYQYDDGTGIYRPVALHVLTLEDGRITAIDDFLTGDARLFSRFGLPPAG